MKTSIQQQRWSTRTSLTMWAGLFAFSTNCLARIDSGSGESNHNRTDACIMAKYDLQQQAGPGETLTDLNSCHCSESKLGDSSYWICTIDGNFRPRRASSPGYPHYEEDRHARRHHHRRDMVRPFTGTLPGMP